MSQWTQAQKIPSAPGPKQADKKTAVHPFPFRKTALDAAFLLGQRLTFAILILLAIIFITYLGLDMAGGTPFGVAASRAVPQTAVYVGRLLQGDMGLTTAGSDTLIPRLVTEVIVERLPRSLGLLSVSLLGASFLGVILGVMAAYGRSQRSLSILLTTLIGVSVPSFFAAFLLQWAVTTYTRWAGKTILPVGGFGWDNHLILPAIVLAARPLAQITRITFVSVREILQQDYVRTARSKGLRGSRILFIHIIRNAAIPILTTIGVSLRFSLSSLPIVELYFGWVGVGFTLLKGIAQQDNDLTIGLTICLGLFFILVNLILDFSYRFIDPRLWDQPAHFASGERPSLLTRLKTAWADWRDWFRQFFHKREPDPWSERPSASIPARDEQTETPATANKPSPLRGILGNFPLIVGGLIVLALLVVIFFGPQLSPNNPYITQGLTKIDGQLMPPPFPPSDAYPWGTDLLGRDIMSLILTGAQQTLYLGALAVAARTILGALLGAVAGWYHGSRLDRFILSAAEVIAAFPTLLSAMILILALGIRRGLPPFIIALCLVGWGEIMQFVRSEVIAIRPQPYIESAVAVGARTSRIIGRHIMPNLLASLISIVAFEMGAVLMLLGELGFISIFIGGGTPVELSWMNSTLYSDVPEWGALLSNVRYMARSYPWTALYPMLAFFVSILGFNLFSEGVRRLVAQGNLVIARVVNKYTIALVVIAAIGGSWLQTNSGAMPFYRQQAESFDSSRAMEHVTALSAPEWNGRALGSPGMEQAAHYIADEFRALGLQAGGEKNSYFYTRYHAFERLNEIPTLAIADEGPTLVYGRDFAAYPGYLATDGQAAGPVRFVGLGQPSPYQAAVWRVTYPELDKADFSGEIVLALSEADARYLARFPKSGLLVVTDDPAKLGQRFTLSGRTGKHQDIVTGEISGSEKPSLWISEETAVRLLAGSGYDLASLRAEVAQLPLEGVMEIPLSMTANLNVAGTLETKWPIQHVLGYLPGASDVEFCTDCLSRNMIVVMAQYDSPPLGPEEDFYAWANNNASGVAVMLEAIRVMQEANYQPYKSFFFVAYSGEGLDGGEPVSNPEADKFLQAKTGFHIFNVEAVVETRGVGGGGDRLEVAAGGSLRLAELAETAAQQMGVPVARADEIIDIGVIYDEGGDLGGQKYPQVGLFWQGWQANNRTPLDSLDAISEDNLKDAGRTLAMMLMILGREENY